MTQTITFASGPRLDADDAAVQAHERKRFRTAMVLSGATHGLVIILLWLLWQPVGDEEVPLPPIPVTIVQEQEGQAGAAGGGDSETAASSQSAASEAASAAQPAASATPPEPEQPTRPVEAAPQPAPEVPSLAQTTITPAPPPQETTEPVPEHKPRPPKPKPTATETAKATPTPAPAKPLPVQTAAPTTPTVPSQTAAAAGSNQPLPPGVGGRGRGEDGSGRAAAGNGSRNGPGDDYLDAVRRWVARFRKYPDEAVDQKQEGVVQVGFRFTRDGKVLDAWIEKSSGFPLLDQAALAMIHAASPIPAVPERYQGDTLTLVMPENFRIGLFDRLFH